MSDRLDVDLGAEAQAQPLAVKAGDGEGGPSGRLAYRVAEDLDGDREGWRGQLSPAASTDYGVGLDHSAVGLRPPWRRTLAPIA